MPSTLYPAPNEIVNLIRHNDMEINLRGVPKDIYNQLLKKCRKNKTKTCWHLLTYGYGGNKQKIYMSQNENLYYRLENPNYRREYTYGMLCEGVCECESGCGWFEPEELFEIDDFPYCRECAITSAREKVASLKIANWFLKCKYNPTFKYCRDRMNQHYDQEYDEDYVEGEKILI